MYVCVQSYIEVGHDQVHGRGVEGRCFECLQRPLHLTVGEVRENVCVCVCVCKRVCACAGVYASLCVAVCDTLANTCSLPCEIPPTPHSALSLRPERVCVCESVREGIWINNQGRRKEDKKRERESERERERKK